MNASSPTTEPAELCVETLGVSEALRRVELALKQGDVLGLESLLPGLLASPDVASGSLDGVVRVLAHHHLSQGNTANAAKGFSQLTQPNEADLRLHTLAKNLEVLREYRPALYAQLSEHRADNPAMAYRFVCEQGTGRVLLAQPAANTAGQCGGQFDLVAPGGQFDAFVQQTRQTLAGKAEQPLALLSIGDGYALTYLSQHPPELFMDQAVAVQVIEPDAERLLAALHVHDWSAETLGGGGPLRDMRFRWYVGSGWEKAVRESWDTDPWTPVPALAVCPDPTQTATLGAKLRELSTAYQQRCSGLLVEMKQAYAARDMKSWVELFGPSPTRSPRMAILTSRFTTVLQYAAKDAAEALRRLGWDVRVLLESHPHERFNVNVFGQMMSKFEPDALMSIDATRHSLLDWVPKEIPYLCWVQDALPKLMNSELGKQIGLRDYVLTFFAPRLINDHNYPDRQCIDMPMMVTAPRTPENQAVSTNKGGPDFIYASNVSGTPDVLIEQSCARAPADCRPLVESSAALMLRHYAQDGSLPTEPDIDELLDRAVKNGELPEHNALVRRALRDALWNPLNTGLYRQQALAWVVQIAEQSGMTLHLHGQGWANNPRFAAFDRGPLDHGALQSATAKATFALHLEPYVCFTHHRMLDATQSGTPVLVRDHPGNLGMVEVSRFLHLHAAEAQSDTDARAVLSGDVQRLSQFEAMLKRSRGLTWDMAGDVVAQVRAWQRAGVIGDGRDDEPPLPHLASLLFHDFATLQQRVTDLQSDPEHIALMLREQQRAINGRLTFDAAMQRVLSRIHGLLTSE